MRQPVSDGVLSLVEPVIEQVLDSPQIVDGCFLQDPGFVLAVSGQRKFLDDFLDVALLQLGGVGEMKVIPLHAVVATCRLLVVAVLRHAELGYLLPVFAPVHYINYSLNNRRRPTFTYWGDQHGTKGRRLRRENCG